MKLYTKRGDAGQTDLFGGGRVSKDDARVEAYGTVDELNAAVGLCLAGDDAASGLEDASVPPASVAEPLRAIQSRLFEIGADLATPKADPADGVGAGDADQHEHPIHDDLPGRAPAAGTSSAIRPPSRRSTRLP